MYKCFERTGYGKGDPVIMINFNIRIFSEKSRQRVLVLSMASILLSGTVGCSSVPDWADPVEWYGDTKRWVLGGAIETPNRSKTLKPIPGIGKNFPKLSSVPMRPAPPSKAERKKIAKNLAADRKGVRYDNSKTRKLGSSVPAAPAAMFQRPASPNGTATVIKKSDKQKTNNDPKLVFGKAPEDIIIKQQSITVKKSKTLDTPASIIKGQNFVQAKPFTIRFPAGTGNVLGDTPSVRDSKVASVLFDVGSKNLSKKARQDIRKAAVLFKQRGGSILVVGHASSRTRDMSWQRHHFVNLQLSHDRAHSVATELRRQGVDATAIRVNAISDSQPAFSEVMPAEEAGNRRVEILIEK